MSRRPNLLIQIPLSFFFKTEYRQMNLPLKTVILYKLTEIKFLVQSRMSAANAMASSRLSLQEYGVISFW